MLFRSIRVMVNAALLKMDALLSGLYEADIKGGRPSIAPDWAGLPLPLATVNYPAASGGAFKT